MVHLLHDEKSAGGQYYTVGRKPGGSRFRLNPTHASLRLVLGLIARIILNSRYNHFGVGIAVGGPSYGNMFTQLFIGK